VPPVLLLRRVRKETGAGRNRGATSCATGPTSATGEEGNRREWFCCWAARTCIAWLSPVVSLSTPTGTSWSFSVDAGIAGSRFTSLNPSAPEGVQGSKDMHSAAMK
jgi:hypothetical protein